MIWTRRLVAAWVLALTALSTNAQDGSLFLKQWEESKQIEGLPDGIYLELLHETVNVRTAPGYEPVDGFYRKPTKLWWGSEDVWRVARDNPDLPTGYRDAGWSSEADAAWVLSPGRLLVVDPNRLPDRLNPSAMIGHLPFLWRYWVSGLAAGSPLGFEPVSPARIGVDGHWSSEVRSADGDRIIRYEGSIAPDGSRLLVESAETRTSGQDSELLGSMRLSRWRLEPLSPTGWIAGEYANIDPDGRVSERYSITTVRLIEDTDRLSELVAIPESDGADPVRGKVTFRSIVDHRPGALLPVTVNGVASDLSGSDRSGRILRISGWLALGALLLGLMYVWMKARK